MNLLTLIRSRTRRGFGFQSLGPNEARVLYDVVVAAVGSTLALAFSLLYVHSLNARTVIVLVSLPVLVIAVNLVFGIYSSLRTAPARKKGVVLLAAVSVCGLVSVLLRADSAAIVLWILLVLPSLALPRLLLALSYTHNPRLTSIAANHRGPVLIIGGAGYIGSHTVDLLLQRGTGPCSRPVDVWPRSLIRIHRKA